MRGGARPGSGRKSSGPTRVTFTVRVKPETKEILMRMKDKGVCIGVEIDRLAQEWVNGQ